MRRTLTLLLLGVALLGCPPKAPPAPAAVDPTAPPPTRTETVGKDALSVDDRIHDAVWLIESGHPTGLARAEVLLGEVVADAPEHALGWFNLGVVQHRAGRLDQARRSYGLALERDPTLGAAHLQLGMIHEERGGLDYAVVSYRSGVRAAPDDMALRAAFIGGLRRQGRLDEAIEAANEALRVNAQSLLVYNELGLAWFEKGDLALARFVYQKAFAGIEGARESATLYANLGRIYLAEGDVPRARYNLERAVEVDPDSVPALVYLARLYLDDQNFADTVPLLERARRKQPSNHGVLVNLAIAYRGVGRFEESRRAYDKALELQPLDPTPHFGLGILLGDHLKRYDEGIAAFRRYVEAGGAESEVALEHIASLEREAERAAKRSKADADRRARDAERAERERLLRESESAPAPSSNPWGSVEP